MSITALELISRAMTDAGFSRPSATSIARLDDPGNKAFYALLKAINVLTQQTPDWGWNESELTTVTVAGTVAPAINSTVNVNIIFWLAIDSTITRLKRVTREWLVENVFPGVSDPATRGKPTYWYVQSETVKVWPTPDAVYTLTYGFQKLPQTFTADDVGSTTLNINDEAIAILQGMVAIYILDQYGGAGKSSVLQSQVTDMNNPYSLLRMAVRNNKLEEKKDRAKFRYPAYFRRSRMV